MNRPITGPRGICVMGRRAFGTGIGLLTESALELLGRRYHVSLYDIHEPTAERFVVLPNGREIPIAPELSGYAAYIYADVLWNGVGYTRYTPPPADGYRIALLAYDSSELPPEWVTILNRDFDAVFFTSDHLVDVAVASGVRIHVGSLALGLDIERQVARPYRPVAGRRVRFGTLSAYHPRKGLDALVAAFLGEFGGSDEAELVIHSNLAIGDTAASIRSLVEISHASNITLSTANLSEDEKNQLLDTFDVYVNASAGEGYSVGPREALAMGKSVVATDIGAHRPLFGVPGVFPVASNHEAPAIYPEIDNRQFGMQQPVSRASLQAALRAAFDFVRSDEAADTAHRRKQRAAEFSLTSLETAYWEALDPDAVVLRGDRARNPHARFPDGHLQDVKRHTGRFGTRIGARKVIVPALDAGFFSLFNTYVSHLTWSLRDYPRALVLPDWDSGRMLQRIAPESPVSYCYSRPEDGNLWNHLFEPPYGLQPEDLDDDAFMYDGGENPADTHNASREPLLTYVHAFKLYQDPQFGRIRHQYNSAIREHVRLLPHLQAEIDAFLRANRDDRFMVAAHVKHPSHVIEQPNGAIADRHTYVDLVRAALRDRGIAESSDDWSVFLATEQERVVQLFNNEFGDHVVRFTDVHRIPTKTDLQFDTLDDASKRADGHQLQHIMAADTSSWSPRLAWEVIRDAYVMASADVLFHAVSNVATAASFIGPNARMHFATPAV